MLREGALDDREIEIEVQEQRGGQCRPSRSPACPARRWACSISATSSARRSAAAHKPRKMTVAESHHVLIAEESDKLLDQEKVVREAIAAVEQNGIVFLDEIDKICGRSERPAAAAPMSAAKACSATCCR